MQVQSNENNALKALVRSVRKSLKEEHGIEVPHAALRASVLRAQGENPHAFARKAALQPAQAAKEVHQLRDLVREAPTFFHPGYDFDGKKLQWLQRAGLTGNGATPVAAPAKAPAYELFLIPDEEGDSYKLALDDAGAYCVPEGFRFDAATLVSQRVGRWQGLRAGMPRCVADSEGFWRDHFGIFVDEKEDTAIVQVCDRSLERAFLLVRMSEAQWTEVVHAVLGNPQLEQDLRADVGEWVGTHYRQNLDALSRSGQAEWVARYLGLEPADKLVLTEAVQLEWVWPDETSDSVSATYNRLTGVVEVDDGQEVPDDITASQMRVRLVVEDEMFEVSSVKRSAFFWQVTPSLVSEVNEMLVQPA